MNVNNCNLAGIVETDVKLSEKRDTGDFILKVKRDRKDKDIYDLVQCSIHGKKAIEFVTKIKRGDCIYVFGSYRSKMFNIFLLQILNVVKIYKSLKFL